MLATAIVRVDRYKSALESDYAVLLEARRRSGDCVWWAYEAWKFSIGAGIWYTPDFVVQCADGTLEVAETKGVMREAARVRLYAAAKLYPMLRWFLVTQPPKGSLLAGPHIVEITV